MAHVMVIRKRKQLGSALIVEVALVLLLLIILTFGGMEYGWLFLRVQQVTNAARGGARVAVLPDATNAEVQQTVNEMMGDWGMAGSGYTVQISSADITALDTGEMITVTVQVPGQNVRLLNMAIFPAPATLTGAVTMAKEGP